MSFTCKTCQKVCKTKHGLNHLKHDLDEAVVNLESSRKSHREEVLLIENSKQQSLALAHQEQRILTERLNETLNNMDEVSRELERHRREANGRLKKDRPFWPFKKKFDV